MPKFKCEYREGWSLGIGDDWEMSIEADSPEEAYKVYIKKVGHYPKGVVVRTGLLSSINFDDHIKEDEKKAEEEQRKQIQEKRNQIAIKCLKFLEQKKEDGYFLLETDDKINAQLLFEDIISDSENGPLLKGELEYIKKWIAFKDRELGQTLLAQAEAKKPTKQQGQSPLGNMLMAGMAMSTMRLSHDIGEVSDQVENISEGFGFEE
jgi:hypothetical protein